MSEWQPIATAPKDGRAILACATKLLDWVQVVWWNDEGRDPHFWSVSDGPTYHKDMFTHWMPLPDPPKGKRSG
jgi:hypothetical protein